MGEMWILKNQMKSISKWKVNLCPPKFVVSKNIAHLHIHNPFFYKLMVQKMSNWHHMQLWQISKKVQPNLFNFPRQSCHVSCFMLRSRHDLFPTLHMSSHVMMQSDMMTCLTNLFKKDWQFFFFVWSPNHYSITSKVNKVFRFGNFLKNKRFQLEPPNFLI
jgi:hypothetical protein